MSYTFTTQTIQAQVDWDHEKHQRYFLRAEADERIRAFLDSIKEGQTYEVTIKQYRSKRSMDANSYCWALLSELSKVMGATKEEIYREIIRQKNISSETVPVRKDVLDKWIENWECRGVGWVCEDLGESKLDGYHRVICNFGSSTFDSKEMSILIDEIVSECKTAGIMTLDEKELERLAREWGGK
jgi:hypothetical protein